MCAPYDIRSEIEGCKTVDEIHKNSKEALAYKSR